MLNNIFQALDSFGLTAQKRALHILFSNPDLNTQVFLQRIDGLHQINQGVRAELICLSTHAAIPLKQFIGCQVAVDQVTDTGTLFRTTGIITEAQQGQSDGSLTLYKLVLQDPTALWHKRRNSRVFMNKTVIEVFEVIFKEWQQRSPLFASSLTLDLSGLTQDYDVRPFIMSQNETDYDFITRLLRSEGINWLIDEDQLIVPNNQTPIQAQKLRLIDDNSQYQALARRSIRYHRSSATEQYDSMTSLIGQRSLQPTAVHIQRWQADALEQVDGAGSVQSTHQHSESYDNNSLSLEDAWHFTPAWMQDLTGADGATASGNPQIEKLNQNLSHYHDSQAKQFIANTTVRDSQVGYWFKLIEHPEIDQHTGADQEFLITAKSYYNQNNLPKDLQQQVHTLISQSQWKQPNLQTEERQANQLILQRRNIPIVSEYNPQQHRPITSPQRAKVVGPSDEEIHVDEWGRIKVRFLFTRKEDHEHDGGAGSNDNDTDSAWIDVLTPWAGEGYGARFLPRIGEIVVINFFDGNIDRPFVTGRIHEAHRSPTKFDNAGKLPDTKKLAGIKSKEVQGEGFNQLRFDDTTGQILRTDQWGAVRAGQGLLLSTHSQEQAQCDHLDAQPAKQQLESNQANAKALSEVAKNQQTDEIESLDQLKEFADQIQEKIAKFEKALLLLNSPAGIGLSTSEDIHLSADGQIDQIAGDSINLSTQKNLVAHVQNRISFFAAQSGIKQVAAKGRFEVHAQSDGMDLLAKQGVQIISTEDRIEISSPKEIVITAGGSQIKLNGSGIFPTTGGKFEVKAGQHLFMGGAKVPMDIPLMPNEIRKQLLLQYHDQEPVQGANFTIRYNNGQQYSGIVNNKGIADITDAPEGEGRIIFGEDQRPYQVVATADENPEYKSAWVIDDFEASYQQALQEKNK